MAHILQSLSFKVVQVGPTNLARSATLSIEETRESAKERRPALDLLIASPKLAGRVMRASLGPMIRRLSSFDKWASTSHDIDMKVAFEVPVGSGSDRSNVNDVRL